MTRGSALAQAIATNRPPSTPRATVHAARGRHVLGIGILAFGLIGLVWGDFLTGQPGPNDFPHRNALAYTAAAFLFLAGALLQWRCATTGATAPSAPTNSFPVVLIINGRISLAHYAVSGNYENIAEQFAALILYATRSSVSPHVAARLTLIGQFVFGLCALIFGGAHFLYTSLTAPLVPTWLLPSEVFWRYLTGSAFFAAGLALLTHPRSLCRLLLTAMLATSTLLLTGTTRSARILSCSPIVEGTPNSLKTIEIVVLKLG